MPDLEVVELCWVMKNCKLHAAVFNDLVENGKDNVPLHTKGYLFQG